MRLLAAQSAEEKFLCIGLDPDINLIPESVPGEGLMKVQRFVEDIVDATADIAAVFKLNLFDFAQYGTEGMALLEWMCKYIVERHPHIPVLLDANFGDIQEVNDVLVDFAFRVCQADAVTVQPHFGGESLKPFLSHEDKGVFVLCCTSNPDGPALRQSKIIQYERNCVGRAQMPLAQMVADQVANVWNKEGNCGLVTCATVATEIVEVRKVANKAPLLILGVEAEGGDVGKAIDSARNEEGGFLVNMSHGILYPPEGQIAFAERSAVAASKFDSKIREAWAMPRLSIS